MRVSSNALRGFAPRAFAALGALIAAVLICAGPVVAQNAPAATAAAAPAATAAPTATAAPAATAAPSEVAEKRLKVLAEELRCLVCQNQTLADSHADLAVDLRKQVFGMIEQGKSDAEIKTYLVERYGDFVLYRPPMQGNTMLLWFGPFALLLLGVVIWLVVQRRSRQPSPVPADPATAGEEQERARKLLGD